MSEIIAQKRKQSEEQKKQFIEAERKKREDDNKKALEEEKAKAERKAKAEERKKQKESEAQMKPVVVESNNLVSKDEIKELYALVRMQKTEFAHQVMELEKTVQTLQNVPRELDPNVKVIIELEKKISCLEIDLVNANKKVNLEPSMRVLQVGILTSSVKQYRTKSQTKIDEIKALCAYYGIDEKEVTL